MISGGYGEVSCAGIATTPPAKCFNKLLYIKSQDLTDGGYALKVR